MRPPWAVTLALALVVAVAVGILVVRPAWYLRAILPLHYEDYIVVHADNYDLEPELLAAVINVESGYDPEAESQAGATGLMQLTPETGQGIADRTGGRTWTVKDLRDPELNIRYGAWYLSHLHEVFADVGDPELAALAAYNAGQGTVREWIDESGGELSVEQIRFDETRAYVERVRELESDYDQAYPQLERSPAGH